MFFFLYFTLLSAKRYKNDANIPVYGSKVSPFKNPFETYDFFSFPFCPYNGNDKEPPKRLADAFFGNHLQRTSVTLNFKKDVNNSHLCKVDLNDQKRSKFKDAINRKFYYQLYIDKLPVWSFVGAKGIKDNSLLYIFTRQHFTIYYNQNRIISIFLNPEAPVSIESNSIEFSYTVDWKPTNQTKNQRIQNYNNNKFFMQSNPLSSVYSVIILACVLILLAIIFLIKSVSDDFSRFQKESEYNDFEFDFQYNNIEKGWKMVHADVFRPPRQYMFLSILFGNGSQIFTALLLYFLLTVIFGQYFDRSIYFNIIIFSYSIAALVGGYFSAGLYKRWGGNNWIKQLVASTYFVPSIFFTFEFILDGISLFEKTLKISKIKPYIVLFLVLNIIILPLTIVGGIVGRHWFIIGPNPARVSMVKRNIPRQPFYLNNIFVSFVIGSLSFLSVYAEIHSILNALVQYQVNFVWMMSLLVLLLLTCVISCLTVFTVYKKLSAEDYEWQWISFLGPFSISFFIYLYSIYYFNQYSAISGILHFLYYFAYTSVLSLTVGIICGFIGFTVSALFVRRIYTNIKAD